MDMTLECGSFGQQQHKSLEDLVKVSQSGLGRWPALYHLVDYLTINPKLKQIKEMFGC